MTRYSFWYTIPRATRHLLVITTICYLAQVLCRYVGGVELGNMLGLHYWGATRFSVLQTITYMFMHGNFSHLFFNMFALYMFGSAAEQALGTRKYLIYYFATGIGAALLQELVWTLSLQDTVTQLNQAYAAGDIQALAFKQTLLNNMVTIGASGAVFGLLLAYGWLYPNATVMFIFLPIPIPSRIFVAIYALVELTAGVANFQFDNVAHYAHLGGMIFGALLLYYWKKTNRL